MIRAIDRCDGFGIYNLGESRTVELRELIERLAAAIGKPARVKRLPVEPGDVPVTFADITMAKARLGYSPLVPVEEGIRRYVAWRKEVLR